MSFIKFSIVIPIHDEEKGIRKTLLHTLNQDYPKDKFEVIAVENGSKDNTLKEIKKVKSKNLRIYSTKKSGISFAKNYGAARANKDSEWLVFLDADTLFANDSLKEINNYILNHKDVSIGTMRIKPLSNKKMTIFWFKFYNLINRYWGSSMCLQIAKRPLFDEVKYDENLKLLEDYKLINDLRKKGRFFYLPVENVYTSARRIEQKGGFRLMMQWFRNSLMPYKYKIKDEYEVIR